MTHRWPLRPRRAASSLLAPSLLALSLLFAASSEAQTTPSTRFSDLRGQVRPGDRIIVRTTDGRTTRGRFAAAVDQQLEVQTTGPFRRRLRVLDEATVSRIEIRDSVLNGALIGLAVGGGVALAGCQRHNSRPDDLGCAAYLLAPLGGLLIGESVDAMTNRPIYVSPGGTTTSVAPLLDRQRIGLVARVKF